ncbi:RNA-binding (RRM/RBD/RNP motif) family protein [Abeliophyllum distichum]|uniref:RNA-binding (RRM/RBD/RNP motif) family protein n=1 Tax=Abeliophyllum distichum TaxID=126358 RepID=A0ABD1T0T8_9LAMI
MSEPALGHLHLVMAKKRKEKSNPNNSSNPDSSSVFKTLFGETIEENATSLSLFSENNPFRRKPQENKTQKPQHELGLGSGEKDAENEGTLRNLNSSELMEKKKRKKDKKESEDFDLELSGESKKLKRDESKGTKKDDISKLEENGTTGGLDVEKERSLDLNGKDGGSGIENVNKKKKRKRDEMEVELEYEARLYGEADEKEKEKEKENNVVGEKRKKMDNPEDMMVSKEGFDDENKLLRTVFVGNLPLKIKKKALLKEFAKFGEVESVRIRSVPIIDVGIFLLVHVSSLVGGNHIRVDRACPPCKKLKGDSSALYDNKRTVFVGNLPFDVKDEEIYQLFTGIKNLEASVEAVRVVRDPGTSLGKGIAYVLFKTRVAAVSEWLKSKLGSGGRRYCRRWKYILGWAMVYIWVGYKLQLGDRLDLRCTWARHVYCNGLVAVGMHMWVKDATNSIVKKHKLKLRDRELRLSHAKSNSTTSKRENFSLPERYNSPAKKFAVDSRNPGGDNKVKAKGNMSYQGMQATKSGIQKKVPARVRAPARSKSGSSTEKPVKGKRPAVAARKLKAQRAANTSKQVGTKRKLDNRTPDSAGQKKKARKFR